IGFFCLIPGPRTRIATSILVWLIEQRKQGKSDNGDTVIIEGEFREETDETSHRVTHKQNQRED
ncbi:MAG: hypothetical protein WD709_00100, partial [Gammaproteobacteria bacterium]